MLSVTFLFLSFKNVLVGMQNVLCSLHKYINEFYGWDPTKHGIFDMEPDLEKQEHIQLALVPEVSNSIIVLLLHCFLFSTAVPYNNY